MTDLLIDYALLNVTRSRKCVRGEDHWCGSYRGANQAEVVALRSNIGSYPHGGAGGSHCVAKSILREDFARKRSPRIELRGSLKQRVAVA